MGWRSPFPVFVLLVVSSLVGGVAAADQPPVVEAPKSVAGTRWQYDMGRRAGPPSTVEFFPDGTLRQVMQVSAMKGTWTQRGPEVEYVIAETTRFRVTITGRRMSGTWTRLKGEQAGLSSPSHATLLPLKP